MSTATEKTLICGCSTSIPCAEHAAKQLASVNQGLWFTRGGSIPFITTLERALLFDMADQYGQSLFSTEKEALDEARKQAKAVEDRWYQTIRAIDARIDEIETAEVASGGL